ncbi:MAG: hypothetical protein COT25_03535 [Candidatus Kerfeldbacteria bacterium CG08_land_8_20_14_0_20_42_7]|uniref:Nudix hydrolase domain-containing protein n=1 Tax=Candidatus Kerfeldbacteria bacterium CG08_land_8_20_14_0_20_42_7 TaxID=2014245 RepID=A0A2H0YS97_9BACT|nr:MAG: hypothetical protein COT25_03535 [Candidatus Kerfeldbacteria bacterium CG08_land_8_20_14_0_20_42_7]
MSHMSTEEFLEIMDDKCRVIGTVIRQEAERANYITQNVLVFVFTQDRHLWIQKRPMSKKHFPGMWDISACGGMLKGEQPQQSAHREQKEEMGFSSDLRFVETFLNEFPGEDGSQR